MSLDSHMHFFFKRTISAAYQMSLKISANRMNVNMRVLIKCDHYALHLHSIQLCALLHLTGLTLSDLGQRWNPGRLPSV